MDISEKPNYYFLITLVTALVLSVLGARPGQAQMIFKTAGSPAGETQGNAGSAGSAFWETDIPIVAEWTYYGWDGGTGGVLVSGPGNPAPYQGAGPFCWVGAQCYAPMYACLPAQDGSYNATVSSVESGVAFVTDGVNVEPLLQSNGQIIDVTTLGTLTAGLGSWPGAGDASYPSTVGGQPFGASPPVDADPSSVGTSIAYKDTLDGSDGYASMIATNGSGGTRSRFVTTNTSIIDAAVEVTYYNISAPGYWSTYNSNQGEPFNPEPGFGVDDSDVSANGINAALPGSPNTYVPNLTIASLCDTEVVGTTYGN